MGETRLCVCHSSKIATINISRILSHWPRDFPPLTCHRCAPSTGPAGSCTDFRGRQWDKSTGFDGRQKGEAGDILLFLLLWPTSRSKRGFKAEDRSGSCQPVSLTEWRAASYGVFFKNASSNVSPYLRANVTETSFSPAEGASRVY